MECPKEFPKRLSHEDMLLHMKEWQLRGLSLVHGDSDIIEDVISPEMFLCNLVDMHFRVFDLHDEIPARPRATYQRHQGGWKLVGYAVLTGRGRWKGRRLEHARELFNLDGPVSWRILRRREEREQSP